MMKKLFVALMMVVCAMPAVAQLTNASVVTLAEKCCSLNYSQAKQHLRNAGITDIEKIGNVMLASGAKKTQTIFKVQYNLYDESQIDGVVVTTVYKTVSDLMNAFSKKGYKKLGTSEDPYFIKAVFASPDYGKGNTYKFVAVVKYRTIDNTDGSTVVFTSIEMLKASVEVQRQMGIR